MKVTKMGKISQTTEQKFSSKQVLQTLQEMRSRLEAVNKAKTEPIAIVGMACRFPGGANDPSTYWNLLHNGIDAMTPVPPDRWDVNAYYDPDPEVPGKAYTKEGGFLEQVDQFDPLCPKCTSWFFNFQESCKISSALKS